MTLPVVRPWLGEDEADAAAAAVRSGWVAQGPRVTEFEAAFAAAVGAPAAVAVSAGTPALHLCLVAAGVASGDEVVVSPLSPPAAGAVWLARATPVFADVDPRTLALTPDAVAAVLTARSKAVILTDTAGVPADLDAIRAVCEPAGVAVVEDAGCAAGATYRGRPVAAGAPLAAFSFHSGNLITTGDGGMVTTGDTEVAGRLRRLREHGMSMSAAERHRARQPVLEQYLEVGFNYRMTDIQAAVGLVQLAKLSAAVLRRRAQAERYRALLADLPGLVTVADPAYGTTNYQTFWVLLPDDAAAGRDEVLDVLARSGIGARPGAQPAHRPPSPERAAAARAGLPVAERFLRGSLVLPLFHQLTDAEQDRVVAAVRAACGLPALPRKATPPRKMGATGVGAGR